MTSIVSKSINILSTVRDQGFNFQMNNPELLLSFPDTLVEKVISGCNEVVQFT